MNDGTDLNGATSPATPLPESNGASEQPTTSPLLDNSLWGILSGRVKDFLRGNPRLDPAMQQQNAPLDADATIGELALDAETPIANIVAMLSSATGDTEEIIRSIEDDKEHPAGRVIVQLMITLGYVAPLPLSILIGIAIGLQYSGGLGSVLGVAIFVVCIFYELGLVWLMFAVVKLSRRVMSTGKGVFGLIGLSLLYLAIAAGSAAAQWAIYEGHIDPTQPAQVAAAIIRTFAVPIVDTICAVALPILIHVSLDKKLAEIQKKTQATIALNKQKISARLELIQEAISTKSVLQKEKDYQAKNDLANQLIDLISQKILADARASLSTGNGNRRDGYR